MLCSFNNCEHKGVHRCSTCTYAKYCCKEHQKSDWKIHKRVCIKPAARSPIIAAIAWHVADKANFEDCATGFRSFTTLQTRKPDIFILSWSAPNELFHEVEAFLTEQKSRPAMADTVFLFLSHNGQLKQFEHYEKISEEIDAKKLADENTWMMFGDADDEWAESRTEVMGSFPVHFPNTAVLLFHCYARHVGDGTTDCYYPDADHFRSFEYWMCLTRYDVFAAFFKAASALHLQSTYCDLAFCAHLKNQGELFHVVPTSKDLCLKYLMYIKHGDGHMKSFYEQSLRQSCVRFLEMKLMRQFPNSVIEPWGNWQNEVDTFEHLQLFTLRNSLCITELTGLKASADDTAIFNSTFRPVCCNDACTSNGLTKVRCSICQICTYCCSSCQDAVLGVNVQNHRQKCKNYSRLLSTSFIIDIFSEDFNHHLNGNVQNVCDLLK